METTSNVLNAMENSAINSAEDFTSKYDKLIIKSMTLYEFHNP